MSLHTEYTDAQLLAMMATNDQQAFETLYARHWAHLYQYAFFILKDQDAVKDVLQDVFVWIWEHRLTLEVSNPKAYLKAAVKFKIANLIRSGRIRSSFFDDVAKSPDAGTMTPAAQEIIEVKELHQLIQYSVAQLPVKCREIYRMSREECLSNREIADRLDLSVKTVENQMTIALRRIRRVVEMHAVFIFLLLLQH